MEELIIAILADMAENIFEGIISWIKDEVTGAISITINDKDAYEWIERTFNAMCPNDATEEEKKDLLERITKSYANKTDGNPENDAELETDGIPNTDAELLLAEAKKEAMVVSKVSTDTNENTGMMLSMSVLLAMFSLFTTVYNFTKNYIFKKCYKGKETK